VMMVTIAMVIVMGREERARKERQGAGIDFFIPCPPTNRPHLRWPYLTHDIWFGHIADLQPPWVLDLCSYDPRQKHAPSFLVLVHADDL
jgi:hypothetical protein